MKKRSTLASNRSSFNGCLRLKSVSNSCQTIIESNVVRFHDLNSPRGVLSYITRTDIALKQCKDQESRTVYPHYDFPEIRPLPRQKNKTNFINWAAPQAAELISACSRSFSWLVNFRDFFYTAWSKVFRKALLSLMKEQVPRLAKSASRQYFTVFRLILASR